MTSSQAKNMAFFQVDDRCNGCLACVQNCPANALRAEDVGDDRTLYHSMTRCARCGNCWRICPQKAILFEFLLENVWDEVKRLDLIRCRECGKPIYTVQYAQTLSDRLGTAPEDSLCAEHKEAPAQVADAHFRGARPPYKEVPQA